MMMMMMASSYHYPCRVIFASSSYQPPPAPLPTRPALDHAEIFAEGGAGHDPARKSAAGLTGEYDGMIKKRTECFSDPAKRPSSACIISRSADETSRPAQQTTPSIITCISSISESQNSEPDFNFNFCIYNYNFTVQ